MEGIDGPEAVWTTYDEPFLHYGRLVATLVRYILEKHCVHQHRVLFAAFFVYSAVDVDTAVRVDPVHASIG